MDKSTSKEGEETGGTTDGLRCGNDGALVSCRPLAVGVVSPGGRREQRSAEREEWYALLGLPRVPSRLGLGCVLATLVVKHAQEHNFGDELV